MRVLFIFITLLLSIELNASDIDNSSGLIKSSGWEHVRAQCGGCHSYSLVISQRADRNTWLDIIRWMQKTQNLWQFRPEIEVQIIDYLAINYPPKPNRRRPPILPSLMPISTDKVQ